MEKRSYTKDTIRIFWQHTRPYGIAAVLSMVFLYSQNAIEILRPWIFKDLVDLFASANKNVHTAWYYVFLLGALQVVAILVKRAGTLFTNRFQVKAKKDIWLTAFNEIQKRSYGYLINQFVGGLVKKANRYDSAYERLTDEVLFGLGQTVFRVVATGIALVVFRVQFALVFFVWFIFYVAFVVLTLKWKRKKDLEKAEADSQTSAMLADSISNYHTVKTFAAEKREAVRFEQQLKVFMAKMLAVWDASVVIDAGQALLSFCLEIAVLLLAIELWGQGQFTAGEMTLVQFYVVQLGGRLWELGRQIRGITQALADANEMTEVIMQEDQVVDMAGKQKLKKFEPIKFENVYFSYGQEKNVIENFSLDIAPKEKIGLIGPSGGGKTTITKLLLRLYPVSSGDIVLGEQSIYTLTTESLRGSLSYVPQDPILFHRSLKENIAYGKPNATIKEVKRAAELAHAHEFIDKLATGYDTLVGERGIKLSGGERQRVAIARAMLKDAPILVMDEATSSLDSESEMLIQDALKHLMKNKTVIVIAHRLSTIMQMDRIVVISGGRIIEQGKHAELLKIKEGTYQKLWDIQAGSFSS